MGRLTPGVVGRTAVRVAVGVMAAAVAGLGGVAAWAAVTMGNDAAALAGTGAQTDGQLRALQALSVIRIQTNALEDGPDPARMVALQNARKALPEALDAMEHGNVARAAVIARQAKPLARALDTAIETYLHDPRGDIRYDGEDGDDTSEDAMDALGVELEEMLNGGEVNPANSLTGMLAEVTASERAVRTAALVLVPIGLFGAAASGWLLTKLRRRADEHLRFAAYHDSLTGLPNRALFRKRLTAMADSATPHAVLLIDLDGFKSVNDTYGHHVGDELLQGVAGRLGAIGGDTAVAARLGGDEFAILLPGADAGQAMAVAEAARACFAGPFPLSCGPIHGAGSVGVALAEPGQSPDKVLEAADARMYAAKRSVHAA